MTVDCLGRDNDQFGLLCEDESRTVQADAIEADINFIVRRFGITGQLPSNLEYVTNIDITDAPDNYQGVMDVLIKARDSFMSLPAETRKRFGDDPALFVDFCSDEKNLDEMRKLGLAVPKKEEPVVVPAPKV